MFSNYLCLNLNSCDFELIEKDLLPKNTASSKFDSRPVSSFIFPNTFLISFE